MADRIHQVNHQIVKLAQAFHQLISRFRHFFFGRRGVSRRGYSPIQRQQGALARAQVGGNVAVALLDVGKQFMLCRNIATLGIFKQRPHFLRRDEIRRVLRNHAPSRGDLRHIGL